MSVYRNDGSGTIFENVESFGDKGRRGDWKSFCESELIDNDKGFGSSHGSAGGSGSSTGYGNSFGGSGDGSGNIIGTWRDEEYRDQTG